MPGRIQNQSDARPATVTAHARHGQRARGIGKELLNAPWQSSHVLDSQSGRLPATGGTPCRQPTPATVVNIRKPATALAPSMGWPVAAPRPLKVMPTMQGAATAKRPGLIMARRAEEATMATQLGRVGDNECGGSRGWGRGDYLQREVAVQLRPASQGIAGGHVPAPASITASEAHGDCAQSGFPVLGHASTRKPPRLQASAVHQPVPTGGAQHCLTEHHSTASPSIHSSDLPSIVWLLSVAHDSWLFCKLPPHLVHNLLQGRQGGAAVACNACHHAHPHGLR